MIYPSFSQAHPWNDRTDDIELLYTKGFLWQVPGYLVAEPSKSSIPQQYQTILVVNELLSSGNMKTIPSGQPAWQQKIDFSNDFTIRNIEVYVIHIHMIYWHDNIILLSIHYWRMRYKIPIYQLLPTFWAPHKNGGHLTPGFPDHLEKHPKGPLTKTWVNWFHQGHFISSGLRASRYEAHDSAAPRSCFRCPCEGYPYLWSSWKNERIYCLIKRGWYHFTHLD